MNRTTNKRRWNFLSAGLSSILLVIVILCLITFAVLSLASADSDYRLSEKAAENNTAYYEGYSAAQEKLKAVDEKLFRLYNESKDEEEYYSKVFDAFETEDPAEGTDTNIAADDGSVTGSAVDHDSDSAEDTLDFVTATTENDMVYLSFVQDISAGDCLKIKLKVLRPETTGDTLYEIETWNRVRENTSESEETAGGMNLLWSN